MRVGPALTMHSSITLLYSNENDKVGCGYYLPHGITSIRQLFRGGSHRARGAGLCNQDFWIQNRPLYHLVAIKPEFNQNEDHLFLDFGRSFIQTPSHVQGQICLPRRLGTRRPRRCYRHLGGLLCSWGNT